MEIEQFIEIEAPSLDQARALSMQKLAQLSDEERATLKEQILETGSPRTEVGSGLNFDAARLLTLKTLPPNSTVLNVKVLVEPDRQSVDFEAANLAAAHSIARTRVPDGYAFSDVNDIQTLRPPRHGFLGLRKSPGRYSLTSRRAAQVEITYRPLPKLRYSWVKEVIASGEFVQAAATYWSATASNEARKVALEVFFDKFIEFLKEQNNDPSEVAPCFWLYKFLLTAYRARTLDDFQKQIHNDAELAQLQSIFIDMLRVQASVVYPKEFLLFMKDSLALFKKDIGTPDDIVAFLRWIGFGPSS